MNPHELEAYTEITMTPEYGAGRIQCLLCRQEIRAGQTVLLVPNDCSQTERMHAKQPYDGQWAHRSCMERVP